jgi:hypothetical protein
MPYEPPFYFSLQVKNNLYETKGEYVFILENGAVANINVMLTVIKPQFQEHLHDIFDLCFFINKKSTWSLNPNPEFI